MKYDIVIVGGGMVGASMACALQETHYKIAVVEAFEFKSDQQPSFDERTVALTYSSRLIFNAIGIWPQLDSEACPIVDIEVSNAGSFGFTKLGLDDADTDALGYVVPTRAIGRALHQRLSAQKNADLYCPATVETIQDHETHASVTLAHRRDSLCLDTKLVIIADGGRSNLLGQLGLKKSKKTYLQNALVGIIGSDRPHRGKAYEHFTGDGPLALLPLRRSDFALAWTLKKDMAEQLKQCRESDFIARIQASFGGRAGQFTSAGPRSIYPLSMSLLYTAPRKRTVVIGNAAHIVHPVAGQGFNLGLRDVGFLHEILTSGENHDPGKSALLNAYHLLRQRETRRVSQFTDGLISIFTSNLFPVKAGRNLGLTAINLLPGVKKGLLRRTMGIHGRQSRLALSGKYFS